MSTETRFGIGFNNRSFSDSGKLTLVGIQIPEFPGLAGYPSGDILVQSISDSMLGALALGSFTDFFPETDSRFQNLPPPLLLEKTYDLIRQEGYFLNNLDSILLLNKLIDRNHIDAIRKNIADGGMTALTISSLQKGKGR